MTVFQGILHSSQGRIQSAHSLRHNIFRAAAYLQMVTVNEDCQVIQLIFVGKTKGLNNLAFLVLTVTHQADNPVIHFFRFKGQGHTHRSRHTLPEITGVPFHSWHNRFYMPRETGTSSSEAA